MDFVEAELAAYDAEFFNEALYTPEGGVIGLIRTPASQLVVEDNAPGVGGQVCKVFNIIMRDAGSSMQSYQRDVLAVGTASYDTIPDPIAP